MEKTSHAAAVRWDIGRTDIGSWSTLGDLVQPEPLGNREGADIVHDERTAATGNKPGQVHSESPDVPIGCHP
jgi:mannose-1-phosphate guanylyltransferase